MAINIFQILHRADPVEIWMATERSNVRRAEAAYCNGDYPTEYPRYGRPWKDDGQEEMVRN